MTVCEKVCLASEEVIVQLMKTKQLNTGIKKEESREKKEINRT